MIYLVTNCEGTLNEKFENMESAARYMRDHAMKTDELLLLYKSELIFDTNDFDKKALRKTR